MSSRIFRPTSIHFKLSNRLPTRTLLLLSKLLRPMPKENR